MIQIEYFSTKSSENSHDPKNATNALNKNSFIAIKQYQQRYLKRPHHLQSQCKQIFNNKLEIKIRKIIIFQRVIEFSSVNIKINFPDFIFFIKRRNQKMVKYIENYALYEQIGAGVYGKVFRAINNTDKKQYAIKVIPITKFRQNKKLEECTVNQINILTNIQQHPHIIRYYDMLKTSNNFYFIYEFCNGGTLDNLIAKQGKLSEQKTLLIFKQLLQAFQILNKYNILHRDMKPDNIFFHNDVIKLGDFGFCKNLSSADQMTRTMLGSPIYMAPEVLKGQIYSNKADIWSLGVVLYEMLFGQCPFQSNSIAKLIEVLNNKQLNFPEQISPFLKKLIQRMLTKDPMQRIGWMQLFQIKISNDGRIQSSALTPKIHSLEEAKQSNENNNSSLYPISTKSIQRQPKQQQPNIQNGNFKKAKSNAMGNNSSNQDNFADFKNTASAHKTTLQGIKLALQICQSKIPNSLGFSFLILQKTNKNLCDIQAKTSNTQIKSMIQAQLKQLKVQQQNINSKMFLYEQKGLDDWKKYLRGKFFQEEKTIGIWFRMVSYLNGLNNINTSRNLNFKGMVDNIKNILY